MKHVLDYFERIIQQTNEAIKLAKSLPRLDGEIIPTPYGVRVLSGSKDQLNANIKTMLKNGWTLETTCDFYCDKAWFRLTHPEFKARMELGIEARLVMALC